MCIWTIVAIWSTSWYTSTSGLGGCHLGFPTSAHVGTCLQWHHWNARPRKRGICIWNFVAISSTSWDISTSGLGGRHLGFPTSAHVGNCLQWHHWNARPRKHGICIWNVVAISSTSWDMRYSYLFPVYVRHFDFRLEYSLQLYINEVLLGCPSVWWKPHEKNPIRSWDSRGGGFGSRSLCTKVTYLGCAV